ncbi:hypothetical protein ESCO_000095 [Escovopsis weberi]|uniref:Uncharacterized protein n=1 Tax=Escovopsis weberi TaxID=150374 RepID=A0A0N0RTB8_ESCWE|nr:hypothetical protein ESCO_000095 [Escovopsis weberi]
MTLPRLKAPPNLRDLVKEAFAKAVSSGQVTFYPTQVCILTVNDIPFQLRFSPALASKPKPKLPTPPSTARAPFDPFADPPPSMLISPLGPAHFLVLNKFAIVPEHFILATSAYKPQTHILEQDDLEATLACIHSYHQSSSSSSTSSTPTSDNPASQAPDDGLFAFFNCGPHSGASQPHRHIQLLPISRMSHDLPAPLPHTTPWAVLSSAPRLPALRALPFLAFAERIPHDISPPDLHATYLRLYRRACRAAAAAAPHSPALSDPSLDECSGEARISYNLAMTRDAMVLCPRLAEGAEIAGHGDDGDDDGGNRTPLGCLSLNGTLLAGTALVKNEVEWDAMRRGHPEALMGVLRKIGIPRDLSDEGRL